MKRMLTTLALGAALVSLGCAQTALEKNWGLPTAEYKAAMVVDPNAGDTEPIEDLDSLSSELLIETYSERQTDIEDDPQRIFIIED